MAPSTLSEKIFCGYFGLTGPLFIAMGATLIKDMLPVDTSKPPKRVGNSYDGPKGTMSDLAAESGTVYCQVIGTMAIMTCLAVYFSGSKLRLFLTQLPFNCIMLKHIFVDGLMPPPPVLAMGFGVLGLTAWSSLAGGPERVAKYVFLGFYALNTVVFKADPDKVLTDTWPEITNGRTPDAHEMCKIFVGVIALYCAMLVVLVGMDSPLNMAVAMTLGMGQVYNDVFVMDSGPPLPVLVMFIIVFVSSWYGVIAAPKSSKKE